MKKLCACGCREEIVWKLHHKNRNIRFISGHNGKLREHKWMKEKVIKAFLKLPLMRQAEWQIYAKQGKLPCTTAIYRKFGSFQKFEEITGKKFLTRTSCRTGKWTKEKIIEAYKKCPNMRLQEWNKYYKKGKLPHKQMMYYHFKSFKQLEKESGKKFLLKKYKCKWTEEKIMQAYLTVPNIRFKDWDKYQKKGLLPDPTTVYAKFKSFRSLEELTGKKLLPGDKCFLGRKGKNEDKILNYIEKEIKLLIDKNFRIGTKYPDGYIHEINAVVEVDESGHDTKVQQIKDRIREDYIQSINPGVQFIRINEQKCLRILNGQKRVDEF